MSCSSLQRSQARVDAEDYPEVAKLRAWYEAEGRGAATTSIGEGLANAR